TKPVVTTKPVLKRILIAGIQAAAVAFTFEHLAAQSAPTPAPGAPGAALNQLMRGMQFPLSNVVVFSQSDNPADVKEDQKASMTVNLLASVFGGWEAIENSALALADSADLLLIPGRRCANGVAVPVGNDDWKRFAQGLREAGNAAYQAAKTKNQ